MKKTVKNINFPELPWHEVVQRVSYNLFHIVAGNSGGSSFIVSLGKSKEPGKFYYILATAWHVVKDQHDPDLDIKLYSYDGRLVADSKVDEIGLFRLGAAIFDTALIIVKASTQLVEEKNLVPIIPHEAFLPQGFEVGWLGFPGIAKTQMCFFKGVISGYQHDPPTYLLDGVAINGVSGGPVFDNRCHLIGLVSAYLPNQPRANLTLPGLSIIVPINAIRYWLEHNLEAIDLGKNA